MARYTDSVCKLCRREGLKLFLKGERCLSPKCAIERRPTPPGMHGKKQTFKRKASDYSIQLREKQKARRIYGVLERQFRRYFEEANRLPGLTGMTLLGMLELRLDNVVFRMGFAPSRAAARQMVNHGHFEVNGVKTDIPSFQVRLGDVIKVRTGAATKTYFKDRAQFSRPKTVPAWLRLSGDGASVVGGPAREDIEIPLNEQLIVEYYSR